MVYIRLHAIGHIGNRLFVFHYCCLMTLSHLGLGLYMCICHVPWLFNDTSCMPEMQSAALFVSRQRKHSSCDLERWKSAARTGNGFSAWLLHLNCFESSAVYRFLPLRNGRCHFTDWMQSIVSWSGWYCDMLEWTFASDRETPNPSIKAVRPVLKLKYQFWAAK